VFADETEVEYTEQELLAVFALNLEQLFNVEVETAAKKTQRADQVAGSVFVITAQEIKENGFTTINDALTLVPGMHVSRNWRTDPITVRGVVGGNEKVLFLVDGQAMTMKGDGLTVFNQSAPVDIHQIEKIEVILGPGSALYGSGAFLAIVNVLTKEPQLGTSVNLDYSTAGPKNLSLTYGHVANDVALSITASTHESNGDELAFTFPNRRPPEYVQTTGVANGYNRVKDHKFSAQLIYQDFSFRLHYNDSKVNWPTSDYGTDFNHRENYNRIEHTAFQANFPVKISDTVESLTRVYFNDSDHIWHGAYEDQVLPTPSGDENWHYGAKYYGIEYKITYEPSDDLSIVSGIEITDNPEAYSVDFKTDYTNSSLYGLVDYQVSEKIAVNLGARIEKYSFRQDSEFIPKAALLFKPSKSTVFKLLYGKAFLAPNAWELQVAELTGNENLKPELFDSFELIYNQIFSSWSSSFSIYTSKITDKLEILDTGFAESSYVFNSSNDKKSKGADWNGTFLFTSSTSINLGASYVDTDEIDELTGLHQSMFGASDWVGYFKLRSELTDGVISLHGKYVKTPDSHPNIDSWTKIDLVYYLNDFYGFQVNLKIGNLFDENIASYTPVSTFNIVTEIPDNARYLALTIEKRF